MSNDRLASVEATLIAQLGPAPLSTDDLAVKIKLADPSVGPNVDFDPKWRVIARP